MRSFAFILPILKVTFFGEDLEYMDKIFKFFYLVLAELSGDFKIDFAVIVLNYFIFSLEVVLVKFFFPDLDLCKLDALVKLY